MVRTPSALTNLVLLLTREQLRVLALELHTATRPDMRTRCLQTLQDIRGELMILDDNLELLNAFCEQLKTIDDLLAQHA